MKTIQSINPLSANPHKIVKHTQTIRRLLPTNCLSVFDHFVGFALTGLKAVNPKKTFNLRIP